MNELRAISAEIADHIANYYAQLPDSATLLDIIMPHAMGHQIAANYPGLGAAFYRLVEVAAREALDLRIGWLPAQAADHPSVSPALAGLIGSKDSSWFREETTLIFVTKTTTGILVQRDAVDILIDAGAVALALGPIIHELVDAGRAVGQARREGYEAGLLDGRERQRIEAETAQRSAARAEADTIADLFVTLTVTA